MKKILIFVMLFATMGTYCVAQNPLPKENKNNYNDTTSLLFSYDQYAMSDFSKDLNNAGNNFLWAMGTTAAAAISAYISVEVYNKALAKNPKAQPDDHILPLLFSVGFGVTSIICYISAANDLKKAAKKTSKIHPIHNGVSVDL